MIESIKVFAPATVANVGSAFDILGFALNCPGDEMIVRLNNDKKIQIYNESDVNIPTDPGKNVSAASLKAFLGALGSDQGFDLVFTKKIPMGSGIGSSAASSSISVFAANELLDRPFTRMQLVPFAMQGELLASGAAHADNVAPCLMGGFTLVRSYKPLDIISIPFPDDLYCTVALPDIEVRTEDSRRILHKEVKLKDAITQWGNIAGLIAGLMLPDHRLIGDSLEDVIIEPTRSILIPGFKDIKQQAKADGALGCSISGSGPSVFALSSSEVIAKKISVSCENIFNTLGVGVKTYVSLVNKKGCEVEGRV